MEGDLNWKMQEELSSEHLIFTWISDNIEPFRIVDLPNIYWSDFENSTTFLLDDEKFIDAVKYIKDIKTISFKDLKSNDKYDEKSYKTCVIEKAYKR